MPNQEDGIVQVRWEQPERVVQEFNQKKWREDIRKLMEVNIPNPERDAELEDILVARVAPARKRKAPPKRVFAPICGCDCESVFDCEYDGTDAEKCFVP